MIKKLERHIKEEDGVKISCPPDNVHIIHKINELVDAVNSIVSVQEKLIDSRFVVETKHEAPADQFEEEQKWIGKLCKFWNDDPNFCWFYKLKEIVVDDYIAENMFIYKHCEPVKPDSELIYHGE